ncbi:hypothetical protein SM938_22530 [Escherichia coli]|nr:hypothetical protein SM938_22530 [Escherichia coli]
MKDGAYRVAKYCQGDGFPSGQGIKALEFLRDKLDREKFFANLAQAYLPTIEQCQEMDRLINAEGKSLLVMYPSMSRDTGAEILELIQNAVQPVPMRLNVEFAAESDCEFAYVIDFDKGTFEVYEGVNRHPLQESERFAFFHKQSTEYYPVRHIKTYQLDRLPTNEEFVAEVEPKEE